MKDNWTKINDYRFFLENGSGLLLIEKTANGRYSALYDLKDNDIADDRGGFDSFESAEKWLCGRLAHMQCDSAGALLSFMRTGHA